MTETILDILIVLFTIISSTLGWFVIRWMENIRCSYMRVHERLDEMTINLSTLSNTVGMMEQQYVKGEECVVRQAGLESLITTLNSRLHTIEKSIDVLRNMISTISRGKDE